MRSPEPRLAVVLRALAHGLAAAAFAQPLGGARTSLAAGLGAVAGALFGARAARTPLRSVALVALAALGLFAAWLAGSFVRDGRAVAEALGPGAALGLADVVSFGLGAAALSFGLRALSARRRSWLALEGVAVTLAFVQLVVAHRQGAINRPFALADPILATGGDPTELFLFLGAATLAVLGLLLLAEARPLRLALHVGVLLVAALLVLLFTRGPGMPAVPAGGFGQSLRGDAEGDEEAERRRGEGQGEGDAETDARDQNFDFDDAPNMDNQRVPVAVVLFHDDYAPPSGVYYLRQDAHSQYNGRKLVGASDAALDRDVARRFPGARTPVTDPPPAGEGRRTVETTVALLAEHTQPFGLEAPFAFTAAQNPNPERFKRVYRVESAAQTADYRALIGREARDPDWSPEQRAHYLEGPEDPRYAELAERILADLPGPLEDDPGARAFTIAQWLGDQGKYSLRVRHADAADPTADFLFGDLTGYCVHFAHAAAFLLREAGVPARIATGYAVDEAQRAGGSALLVSGDRAHAWPEVYLAGLGWTVLDVYPQTVLDPPGPPADADLQRLLGELARGLEDLPLEEEQPAVELPAIRSLGSWSARVALGALAFALLVLYAMKGWRRLAPRVVDARRRPRAAYRAALDGLSEVRLRRRPGESREAFAARVAREAPELGPSFEALTRTHVGLAFGSRRAEGRADRALHDAAALAAARRKRFGFGLRLLGLLTPWSWITAR
ncbi:MAG: transglutaminase-like domain-containing protein [Myxococcota bacterium]